MTLTSGRRLGPYEIVAALGAGGMGEVYKARDTRLDRTVAVKVLPAHFSADPDRRARFEREAKTIAGLSHPHICTLHDVGEADGTTYLVMEHLAGETLADRLRKGPLPLAQALELGAQIADALTAAHRQGVVHRDLKPGNVMLTKRGGGSADSPQAKLLDFGLAKLSGHGEHPAAASLASAPTVARPLTSEGAIVGTLQYMAPEQVEGRAADARVDIWALGAILYEMVTGRRAFEGASAASLIGNIMNGQPPALATVQPLTPPALDRVVRKCLAKDPDARWQSAADLGDELRWLAGGSEASGETAPATGARGRREWLSHPWRASLLALAVVVAGGTAGALLWRALAPKPVAPVERSSLSFADSGITGLADLLVSRDGRTFIVSGTQGSAKRLYVRRLGEDKPVAIEGSENGLWPCFSPDDASLAYSTFTAFRRAEVSGGTSGIVSATQSPSGPCDWQPDGTIWFDNPQGKDAGLWSVPARGGAAVRHMAAEQNTGVLYPGPRVLPGGRAVLLTVWTKGHASIAAYRLDTHTLIPNIVAEGAQPRYVAETGHLLYNASGTLYGVRFDPQHLTTSGEPRILLRNVGVGVPTNLEYAVSTTGTLAYIPATVGSLWWVDRHGATRPTGISKKGLYYLALSPAGDSAVLGVKDGPSSYVYITSLATDAIPARLTPGDEDFFGTFTPDGKQVLFTAPGTGRGYNIYSIGSDARGPRQQQTHGENWEGAFQARTMGPRTVLLYNEIRDGRFSIWEQELGRPETAHRFDAGPGDQLNAQLSPDGRWLAYRATNESGDFDVYVQGYPSGPRSRITSGGGEWPTWNPRDAGELFYQVGASIYAVKIVAGARVGSPSRLFDRRTVGSADRTWDVAPNGDDFLVLENPGASQINVITNWFSELEAKFAK